MSNHFPRPPLSDDEVLMQIRGFIKRTRHNRGLGGFEPPEAHELISGLAKTIASGGLSENFTSAYARISLIYQEEKERHCREAEEAELRRLRLEPVRGSSCRQLDIRYSPELNHLMIGERLIKIANDTNQGHLCKVLFKNRDSMEKVWAFDEVLEQWGNDSDHMGKAYLRKVYEAARSVNTKAASITQGEALLIYSLKEVKVNPALISI